MKVFECPRQLLGSEGASLGPSDWLTMDQLRINGFADATEDRQWIHVDEAKAATGPFGKPIAHGFLTLSLVNKFLPEIMEVRGLALGVNVGCNRVRFITPVTVGSRIRATGEVVSAEEKKGGIEAVVRVTVAVEGKDKPACVADTVARYYPLSE